MAGSNYSRFLPPNSYIDARQYHPKELAALLLKLTQDPAAYGKYVSLALALTLVLGRRHHKAALPCHPNTNLHMYTCKYIDI